MNGQRDWIFFFCANEIGVVAANGSTAEKTRCEKRVSAYLISLLSKTVYSTLKRVSPFLATV